MIKISSFYPFQNLSSVVQEFYEDKAHVKIRSLAVEREFEFEYKDVAEISEAYQGSQGQSSFCFWLIFGTGLTLAVFHNILNANLIWIRIAQSLFVCGILLYITSFIKDWYIIFSDKNENILTNIRMGRHNRDLVLQIIEKIKSKSENIREITSADPLPETEPIFEHIYFDVSDLKKTTDRFYENEIIGFEWSLFEEKTYRVSYNALTGNFDQMKVSNGIGELVINLIGSIIMVILGLYFGFDLRFGVTVRYILYMLAALLAISWLLRFVKREIIALYNSFGKIEYWAYFNRAEKEKIGKIVEFIQSRIPDAKINIQ